MRLCYWIGLVALVEVSAGAQEIGYVERFALASNRTEVLRELIPGTDDHFYYHALQAQNAGQRVVFQETLDQWVEARDGQVPERARELLNRQALLDYERTPSNTIEYLKAQLKPELGHVRAGAGMVSNVSSRYFPVPRSPRSFVDETLAADTNHLVVSEPWFGLLAGKVLTPAQRRQLLTVISRPDFPGLVDLIIADLAADVSRSFGQDRIHGCLTLAQLDELLQKKPELRNETAFVQTYLSKLGPEEEVDVEVDAAARQAYLERLWAFVRTLEPVHNSLKAHVLCSRLQHDLKQGVCDPARFMEYVRIPRDVPYLADEVRNALPRGDYMAKLGQSFNLPGLPGLESDAALVRVYLLKLLAAAADYQAYAPYIRDEFLKRVFAEAKITSGAGDPRQWAALMSPDDYRRLSERVDVDFAPENPVVFAAGDPVRLTAFIKNVSVLTVKVYELDTVSYCRETGRSLDLSLDLAGVVATFERRVTFSEPAERRVARTFDFPELGARGAYVVELIGNGRQSRALIQKGRLNVLQEITAAGHAFTVYDEDNNRLTNACAWLAGREFTPDSRGRLMIPFSTAPGKATLVVAQGGFASCVPFEHMAETYELAAGFYVDREALLRREKAQIAVRPALRVNSRPASLKLLEDPRLVIRAEDLHGIVTEREIPGVELREDAELIQEFTVPDDLAKLTVTLKARVRNVSRNEKQEVSDSGAFALNWADHGLATYALHARRVPGARIWECRGKNGEPVSNAVMRWTVWRSSGDCWYDMLKTDEKGVIQIVDPGDFRALWLEGPGASNCVWDAGRDSCVLPSELHGRVGEVLRVPVMDDRAGVPMTVSLLEQRQGQFVRDWQAALSITNGFVEITGLPAGEYSLCLKQVPHEIKVRVTQGVAKDGFVLSARRALALPRLAPLQITGVAARDGTIEVRLANATALARVHVLATRYRPGYDAFERLGSRCQPGDDSATLHRKQMLPGLVLEKWHQERALYSESGVDIGDERRYILDRQYALRFPGNMLERPGLLLNPRPNHCTDALRSPISFKGMYGSRSPGARGNAIGRGGGAGAGMARGGGANLDFLKQPAVTMWNLRPDKDGVVRVRQADLKGLPDVRILAVDPQSTVLRHLALPDTPMEIREVRQTAGLDPARMFVEQKAVTPLPAGGVLTIGDVTTAQFEICDSLAKAYRLFVTLSGKTELEAFAFLPKWPTLTAKEKRSLYSRHACHELNFFLHEKDPAFFKEVVAPYLGNKRDKTFMDRWLLDEDLSRYLEFWRFERLSALERALLGRRMPDRRATLVRNVVEWAAGTEADAGRVNECVDTAIQSGILSASGGIAGAIRQMREEKDEVFYRNLPAFSKTSAGAAPSDRVVEVVFESDDVGGVADMPAAVAPVAAPEPVAERAAEVLDESEGRKQAQQRFYRPLSRPQEWAEQNYYNVGEGSLAADLMPASPFWADYAAHDGRQPFLSPHFPEATRNVNEMLMVLAVLDLPFEPAVHKEAITGTQYVLTAGSPLMVFHRQIAEATAVETGEVMVAQHFFRADEADGGAALDEYLPQVPYGARVLLTNPSQDRQTLSALLQIPAGAIPLKDGFYTRRVDVALDPYASATIEYFFYFPATGVFRHYPATLARAGAVVARAAPATFTVVAQARHVDKTSWDWIAENGSEADVVAYLEREAGSGAGYEEIAWRMRDRAFFKKVTGLLEARHIYSGTLWAYSLLHNDVPALRAYVAESELAYKCGGYLDSPLLVVEPAERGGYQHFEYAPLVNPRAHRLGGKHRILDAGLLAQYGRLMGVLSWKAVLSDADELEVAYYMMLQDRVAEALDWFSRVDRKAVAEHLQYDYLDVYLAFYRGDTQGARRIAMRHLTEPVDRWRNRFEQAVAQLDEAEKGGDAAVTDPESRDQDQGALAAAAPWLELQVEAGRIRLDYRNMKSCTLNFYPMDIEVLFSQSPFMQEQKASFAFVRPAVSRTVELEGGKEFVEIELPAEFRTRNVMVEARGAGLRKSQGYYANTLKVQFAEAYGQLLVQHAGTRKPVVGAYVKVYARSESGGVTFVKDGYTDLRGRFDYASLNTGEIEEAARLAVLVLSEKDGAVVREVAPPKR